MPKPHRMIAQRPAPRQLTPPPPPPPPTPTKTGATPKYPATDCPAQHENQHLEARQHPEGQAPRAHSPPKKIIRPILYKTR